MEFEDVQPAPPQTMMCILPPVSVGRASLSRRMLMSACFDLRILSISAMLFIIFLDLLQYVELLDDAVDVVSDESAENFIIYCNYRSKSAGSDAPACVQGEHAVVSTFAHVDG